MKFVFTWIGDGKLSRYLYIYYIIINTIHYTDTLYKNIFLLYVPILISTAYIPIRFFKFIVVHTYVTKTFRGYTQRLH